MKTNPWLALTLTLFLFCARGQIPLPLPANGPVVVEAGPHHRIWRTVAVDEQGQTHIGSFTEIATGLNYFDPVTKQWQESRAQFQIAPDGSAIATNGQHQVILSADINSGGSVDLLMPDGQRLLSNPMGLSFFDTASGMNVLIAEVTNCIGQLIGSNQVLYANAFDTLKGAIRYTYTRDGFEQDLILYENPGSPADYGLNPATTRLEMYTEFHNHPTPQLRTHPPANGSEDETVSFGQMQVVRGASYVLNDVLEAVGVEKTWARIDGRQFLIESVNYNAVQPLLEKVQASAGRATKTRVAKVTFSERRQFVSQLLRTKKKESRVARITPAGSSPKSGLVMDYLLLNTSQANYTFKGDTTYYVSGIVNLSGTTILEGGAVIKYTNNAQINITGSGAILSCKTSSYRPAIFTSKDDNSVGDTISGSDGNPSDSYHANVALNFDYYSSGYPANLQYVRFTYLNNGIGFFGGTGHVLSHAQFAYCNSALNVYYTDYSLRNVLIASVNNVFNNSASCSGRGEHLTIHSANNMCSYGVSPVTLFLTNSVLAAVSNPGSYSGSNNGVTSTDTGVFQSAGAGYHYLASESPYRNAGTTSINSTLLSELKKKTTYPPVVLTSDFNVSTTLSPQVQRDTDTPDLGYHYDPLDYCWSGLNILNNVSVTLTNGVAVGLYGTQGTLLQNASKLISEGTPSAMNRLTRYSTVQEQAVIWGTSGTTFSIFAFNGSITTGPEVRLAFTDVSLLAAPISKRRLLYNGGTRSTLSLQDCWLRGG